MLIMTLLDYVFLSLFSKFIFTVFAESASESDEDNQNESTMPHSSDQSSSDEEDKTKTCDEDSVDHVEGTRNGPSTAITNMFEKLEDSNKSMSKSRDNVVSFFHKCTSNLYFVFMLFFSICT